jgi:hypothetical protein
MFDNKQKRNKVMHNFEEIGPLSHAEAEVQLLSQVPELVAKTLVAMGLHDRAIAFPFAQTTQFEGPLRGKIP